MNILLTGAISLSNKGTASIVISTIVMLKKRFPNSDITLELFFPSRQKNIIDMEKEYRVEVIAPLTQLNFKGLKKYKNADVIIDISAEAFVKYYDDDWLQMTTRFFLHLLPLLLGAVLNKPIVLLAQTLGPFGPFRPIMGYLIGKATLVTVRDSISLKNLEREGIDVSRIFLTADPAFLIDVAPRSRIKEILEHEGIDKVGKKKIIGLCAARTTGRVLSSGEYKKIVNVFANAIDSLIGKYDAAVVFIPHSSGKIRKENDDIIVGMDILREVKRKEGFLVIKKDYSPQELKGIIGTLDCLISFRMHPVIFASSLLVPSIIVAFNPKAYGLMRMLGLEKNVIHVDEIQEDLLVASIERCLQESQYMKKNLKSVIPHLQERALMNVKMLEQILTYEKA